MSDKKRLIELTIEIGNNQKRRYTGRFLGFIKDDEFNALTQSKELAHKIESKETKSLTDVCGAMDDLTGHRLVMTVKKVNDVSITRKKLFVSEKLHFINNAAGDEVSIWQEDGEEIEVKEI